eukprot:CAMPEP_0201574136 /NCGR_PEP_ID=MMETSP0190_2-20130828/18407_1 /ASSEMBLY_ACC=CAM_ASM_000263 /TAXON_ID=37353 /ORGANISM="Rosalina sp." /LENGTH=101 /DNA_ID=CAMNT_0048001941 /DNA_START=250 /DNA_END=552 /DNA_ORIENTATION=+
MINAKDSGQLAIVIKDAWKLKQLPIISNIKYQGHESKDRRKNTISVRVTSDSTNMEIVAKMHQNLDIKPYALPSPPTTQQPGAEPQMTFGGEGEDYHACYK